MMILNGAIMAQCLEDTQRKCEYDQVEVGGKYNLTTIVVTITSREKKLVFKDFKNNDSTQYAITECYVTENALIYECINTKHFKTYSLIFGNNEFDRHLIITCAGRPLFKFKKDKE